MSATDTIIKRVSEMRYKLSSVEPLSARRKALVEEPLVASLGAVNQVEGLAGVSRIILERPSHSNELDSLVEFVDDCVSGLGTNTSDSSAETEQEQHQEQHQDQDQGPEDKQDDEASERLRQRAHELDKENARLKELANELGENNAILTKKLANLEAARDSTAKRVPKQSQAFQRRLSADEHELRHYKTMFVPDLERRIEESLVRGMQEGHRSMENCHSLKERADRDLAACRDQLEEIEKQPKHSEHCPRCEGLRTCLNRVHDLERVFRYHEIGRFMRL